MSCNMEINPKWTHAIDINVCPFCGQGIMEEHLKNLFSSLRQTMESLKDYSDQLNDWMLSNHNYIKTDSPNIHLYMPKGFVEEIRKHIDDELLEEKVKPVSHDEPSRKSIIKMDNGHGQEQEVVVEKVQSEEKTNDFFKRAEAVKPNIDGFKSTSEKTQHLKAMAQQIKREGSTVINKAGLASHLPPEMIDSADPAAVAEFEAILNGGEVQSSLPDNSSGDDDIPSIVLNMANRSRGKVSDQDPTAELERMQAKVDASRRNFNSGGKGSFSRS